MEMFKNNNKEENMAEIVKEGIKDKFEAPGRFIKTKIDLVKQNADRINSTLTTAADDAVQSFQFLGQTYVVIQVAFAWYQARQLKKISNSVTELDRTFQRSSELLDFIERTNGIYLDHQNDKLFVMVQSSSLRDRIRGRLNRSKPDNDGNSVQFDENVKIWLDKQHIYHPKQAQEMFNDASRWKESNLHLDSPIVFYFYAYKQECYTFPDTVTVPSSLGSIRLKGDYDHGDACVSISTPLCFASGEHSRQIVVDGIADCKVTSTGGKMRWAGNHISYHQYFYDADYLTLISKTLSYLLYRLIPGNSILVKDMAHAYLPCATIWYHYMHLPGTFSCLAHLYLDLFHAAEQSTQVKVCKYVGYVVMGMFGGYVGASFGWLSGVTRLIVPEIGYYLGQYLGLYLESPHPGGRSIESGMMMEVDKSKAE